jgi:hypothetical protein
MMTRHFGLSWPLNSVREYFVGVFAASAIALFSCCDASGPGLYGGSLPIAGIAIDQLLHAATVGFRSARE